MNFDKNILKMIEYPSQGILSKEIIKTDNLDITLFCMAESTEISEHTSTRQGFVYVIEGKGVFNLKGDQINMEAGVSIFMEKNAMHSLKADDKTSFLLILFGKA